MAQLPPAPRSIFGLSQVAAGTPPPPPPYNPTESCVICCDLSQAAPGPEVPWSVKPHPRRYLRELSLDDVKLLAREGCAGCGIISDGIAQVLPHLNRDSALTPQTLADIDAYGRLRRESYSTNVTVTGPDRRDHMIDRVDETSSGMLLKSIFRANDDDRFGTIADLDIFTTDQGSPYPSQECRALG